MALLKSIETESGAIATYHRIKNLDIRHKSSVCVVLACFVNEAAKDAGKMPLSHITLYFGPELALETVSEIAYQAVYNAIKALPEFEGAIDC